MRRFLKPLIALAGCINFPLLQHAGAVDSRSAFRYCSFPLTDRDAHEDRLAGNARERPRHNYMATVVRNTREGVHGVRQAYSPDSGGNEEAKSHGGRCYKANRAHGG